MEKIIELVFKELDYYATFHKGVFLLFSDRDVLIPNPSVMPTDFVEFTKGISENNSSKAVNGRALFAREIFIDNNNFKTKEGKWEVLTTYPSSRSFQHIFRDNWVEIRGTSSGQFNDLLSRYGEPIYSNRPINRKVEDIGGTFPECHSCVIPKSEVGLGENGYVTASVPGYMVKIALETNSNILIQSGTTCIANNDFHIICSNVRHSKEPELKYSCGNKTRLRSDRTSWLSVEKCKDLINECSEAYNILKEPKEGSSLYQMCQMWASQPIHDAVEGLMWNGFDENQILGLIFEDFYLKQVEYSYKALKNLQEMTQKEMHPYEQRGFSMKVKVVEDIFCALIDRGLEINEDTKSIINNALLKREEIARRNHGFY